MLMQLLVQFELLPDDVREKYEELEKKDIDRYLREVTYRDWYDNINNDMQVHLLKVYIYTSVFSRGVASDEGAGGGLRYIFSDSAQ